MIATHSRAMTWAEIEKRLYPHIHNMLPATQARQLYEDARALPTGAVILEIGAYHGLSTCALAYGCVGQNKRVYTIDTFRGNPDDTDKQDGEPYFTAFWQNVMEQGLDAWVYPRVGRSEDFYATWRTPLDLLFIDGGHDHVTVAGDLNAFLPHLKRGGVLLMHDMFPESDILPWPGMTFIAGNLARGVKP